MEVTDESYTLKEDRQTLMWLHLSQLANLITGFGGLIIPIVLWQVNKDKILKMDQQGKEVVNFQISMILYAIIAGILVFVLIGIPILVILGLLNLIFPILNGIKVNNGEEPVKYPLAIKFIK